MKKPGLRCLLGFGMKQPHDAQIAGRIQYRRHIYIKQKPQGANPCGC